MAGKKRGPVPGTPEAKRGGQALRDQYGVEHLRTIGKKGGSAVKAGRDAAFYAEIGKKGGAVTRERYGVEHYRRIGKQGGLASRRPGEGA